MVPRSYNNMEVSTLLLFYFTATVLNTQGDADMRSYFSRSGRGTFPAPPEFGVIKHLEGLTGC